MPKGTNPPPILLSSKPVKLASNATANCAGDGTLGVKSDGSADLLGCGNPLDRDLGADVERQWIDVGFWVTPDGGVRDIDVVRRSDRYAGDWAKDVTKSIGTRRYSPTAVDANAPGLFRVERFTLTAGYSIPTRSRIRVRDPNPVIETVDITPG